MEIFYVYVDKKRNKTVRTRRSGREILVVCADVSGVFRAWQLNLDDLVALTAACTADLTYSRIIK